MKKTYRVTEMHCPNCAMRLEGLEDRLPGIRRIEASYHKQQMVVEVDERQWNEADLLAAAKAMGYTLAPEKS